MDINKGTRTLLIIMIGIVAISLTYAYFYYKNINENVDPRLIHTQEVLSQFDQSNKLDSPFVALKMMEDIEQQLLATDLYKSSYEIGVIRNNKASVYLMMALYGKQFSNLKDSLFSEAMRELTSAESIYLSWIDMSSKQTDSLIVPSLIKAYQNKPELFVDKDIKKVAQLRYEDLILAKTETPRRLSVCYSNMAVVYRHTNQLDSAIARYQKALELWPENHEAENNLKTLFGLEREKRGVVEKLFPSKRIEE